MARDVKRRCKALARTTGEQCKNPALIGFDVCRMHGGKGGRPIIHGRYSLTHRQALADKMQAFLEDDRPGDLTDELALTRALLQDYLERFPDRQPLPADDIGRIFGMVEAIGKTVERISRILNSTAVTIAEVRVMQATFANLMVKYIGDAKRQSEFLDEFNAIAGNHQRHTSVLADGADGDD